MSCVSEFLELEFKVFGGIDLFLSVLGLEIVVEDGDNVTIYLGWVVLVMVVLEAVGKTFWRM